MADALERFRTTVPTPQPDTLSGAARTRDELVRRFADAVERADTVALIRMVMNRAEFAYLYYPHTRYARRPYELDAETTWLLTKSNAEKGLTRILGRFGGKPVQLRGYDCSDLPIQEGPNRYWQECTLTVEAADAPATMRWFGSIWERAGRFKFVSFVNDL